ncbi:UNVERIFIED_CONTAM: hypothetical protein Sradi_0866800 [Sesamum radiatum]|uniref:Uncharacterized protein n=1 Tax=Sesamum radiatum TaxID=300843 RepID=A0AAW2V2R0_SESRA
MANSNNGGDHGCYEGDSSLPAASGPVVPLIDPTLGDANVLGLDLVPGANAPAPLLVTKQPDLVL